MHIAEYTSLSLAQRVKCGQKQKIKATRITGQRCFITICIRFVSISQRANEVPVSGLRQPTPYFQRGKIFGVDAHTHTFGSSPAQRNLPEKLNGVFVFARSSVHSILTPVNLLSCVICAPPS